MAKQFGYTPKMKGFGFRGMAVSKSVATKFAKKYVTEKGFKKVRVRKMPGRKVWLVFARK